MTASVSPSAVYDTSERQRANIALAQRRRSRGRTLEQLNEARRLGLSFQAATHQDELARIDSEIAKLEHLLGKDVFSRAQPRRARPRDRKVSLAPIGGVTGRDRSVEIAERTVPSPYQPGSHERVTVNVRIDILEQERRNLDEHVFQAGRLCQAMWERATAGSLRSSLGSLGGGGASDHEFAVALGADDAKKVVAFNALVVAAVGSYGMQVLRRYLVEGKTFRGYVGMLATERMVAREAGYFRRTLENLSDALGATGPDRALIRASRGD